MNDLISVIVPIYKVEAYLDKCVDSIVNQTYKNLEIILVDDGSPDKCPEMCDVWAQKDDRIKVIHKPNGGLSDARNVGMNSASGEYICFIDGDDLIHKEFVERLLDAINNEGSDIADCEVLRIKESDYVVYGTDDYSTNTYNTESSLSFLIDDRVFRQHVCNKMYKTSIASSVNFEVGKINEDEFWTYQVFGKANKVTKIGCQLYYYLQHDNSIMNTTYNIRRLDALEAKVQRQKYIENNFPNLASQAKLDLYGSCIFAGQSIMKYISGKDKKKALSIVNKYVKEYKLSKEEIAGKSGKSKIWLLLANVNFYLCCRIRNILRIGF